jgi:O-antigen/teichoic acid export membrane protein
LREGASWNLLGAVLNQGSTFAANIVLANLLGRQQFGEYAMVQATLNSVTLLAQLSMGYTATKYIAEFRGTDNPRAGRILGLCLLTAACAGALAALLLLAGAQRLATDWLRAPQLSRAIALGAWVVLAAVFNGILIGVLSGLEAFRALSRALVWSGLLYLIVVTAFGWLGGRDAAVAALAVSGTLQTFLLWRAVRADATRQGIRATWRGLGREWHVAVHFALPGTLGGLIAAPALWIASAMLASQPGGYAQLALYSASYNLMILVFFLPSIINVVATSLINREQGSGRYDSYRHVFWLNMRVTAATAIGGAIFIALIGRFALRLFGEQFVGGYGVLIILLLAIIPESLTIALNQVIQSQARMWLAILAINLPRDLALIALARWLVPGHGAVGLAVAYAGARLLAFLCIAAVVARIGEGVKRPAAPNGRRMNSRVETA